MPLKSILLYFSLSAIKMSFLFYSDFQHQIPNALKAIHLYFSLSAITHHHQPPSFSIYLSIIIWRPKNFWFVFFFSLRLPSFQYILTTSRFVQLVSWVANTFPIMFTPSTLQTITFFMSETLDRLGCFLMLHPNSENRQYQLYACRIRKEENTQHYWHNISTKQHRQVFFNQIFISWDFIWYESSFSYTKGVQLLMFSFKSCLSSKLCFQFIMLVLQSKMKKE